MFRKCCLGLLLLVHAVDLGQGNELCSYVFQLTGDNSKKSLTLFCPLNFDDDFYITLWHSMASELNCSNTAFCIKSDVRSDRPVDYLQKKRCNNGIYVFENVTDGHYCAKLCSLSCNLHTETHHLKFENTTNVVVEKINYSALHFWIIAGITVLVCVGLICLMYKCHSKCRQLRPPSSGIRGYVKGTYSPRQSTDSHGASNPGQIFILYNYDNDKHFRCVQQLAELLRSFFWSSKIVIDRQCIDDIVQVGVEAWVRSQLNESDKVIVISSEGAFSKIEFRKKQLEQMRYGNINHKIFNECPLHPDTFLFGWTAVTSSLSLSQDYRKVLNVRFGYTDAAFLTPLLVPNRHYVLPAYVEALLGDLGDFESDSAAKFLSMSQQFKDLLDAIQAACNNNTGNEETHWIRPGL